MGMYRRNANIATTLRTNQSVEGERIEQKIERIVQNKEPIKDGAPIIYTERKDGVQAAYNIRTDRFELAVDAIDAIQRQKAAKRAEMKIVKDEPTSGDSNANNDSTSSTQEGGKSQ